MAGLGKLEKEEAEKRKLAQTLALQKVKGQSQIDAAKAKAAISQENIKLQEAGRNERARLARENSRQIAGMKLGKEKEGKIIPEKAVENISDADSAISEMNKLIENIKVKSNLLGPVKGRVGAANPYNKTAQELQAEINRVRQMVGKALEGGVLRKEDEEKYLKIVGSLTDTPDVIINKLQGLVKNMSARRAQAIKNLGTAGYNVKNFDTSAPVAQAPTGSAAPTRTIADIDAEIAELEKSLGRK